MEENYNISPGDLKRIKRNMFFKEKIMTPYKTLKKSTVKNTYQSKSKI